MEILITGKNIKLLPAVRSYIERRLAKLSRHLPNIMELKVEVAMESTKSADQRFVAQVTIDIGGTLLRGEERADDIFAAIDKVAAVMDRQIERYKGKLYHKGRGASFARGGLNEEEEEVLSTEKVVRVKRFAINPMSAAEAIEQMELLHHNFFLFYNGETQEINLVYRRRGGDYGIIEPELS